MIKTTNRPKLLLYITLRAFVFVILLGSLFRGNYLNVLTCLFALLLFETPSFINKKFDIRFPNLLEVVIVLFVFASLVLGELRNFYFKYPHWDTMLHTISGLIFAAIGFSFVDILNQNTKIKFHLSPIFMSIMAFCFSMTIGVMWEFIEFGCDQVFHTDMQKDTIINYISSTKLDKTNSNNPVVINDIHEVTVNDQKLDIDGYLDIGLIDTMKDLFVNFIGALVFSIIGYFYSRNGYSGKFMKNFIVRINE